MTHLTTHVWRIASAAAMLLCANAFAALGQAPQPGARATDATAGVPSARQLRALPPSSAYSVATTTLPSGTVVREFVNAQQVVFAVVWQGPVLPDLVTFFGEHAAAYQQAVQQKRAAGQRGGAVQSRQSDLVIVSRGRMGHFEGYAYLPTRIPAGIDITTLLP